MWPIRSMLFIPAHRLEWIEKAGRFKPDAVILDLEDAVPHAEKERARAIARQGLPILARQGILPFVRVNALGEGCREDLAAVVALDLKGVILPKARSAAEVAELDRILSYEEGRNGLAWNSVDALPHPETAEGMVDARQLASASRRVKGVLGVVGGPVSGDVARAAGFRPTREGSEQIYLNSKIVLESRAGGAPYPIAGIIGAPLEDLDFVRVLVTRARDYGYAGVMLIHPKHVAVANEVFAPSAEEIAYYTAMIVAFREAEAKGLAALDFRGQMVDLAMIRHAEDVLAEARRRGAA